MNLSYSTRLTSTRLTLIAAVAIGCCGGLVGTAANANPQRRVEPVAYTQTLDYDAGYIIVQRKIAAAQHSIAPRSSYGDQA